MALRDGREHCAEQSSALPWDRCNKYSEVELSAELQNARRQRTRDLSKRGEPTLFTVGLFQFARLKALNASAWNCRLHAFPEWQIKVFRSDRSHW